MFQCLLCMLSSLLMLLTSLISFLVRSLYNSYLLLVFRQCFVLLSHFCFLRSRPPREIFSFPILSLSRFPLRQADTAFHFPFLALYFALFIISICFPFTNSLLPFVFLCFFFCRHPISSRPPCKKLMEAHLFLITIVLSKKKKAERIVITANKLGRWARRLIVRIVSVNIAWQVRDKLTWSFTLRKLLVYLMWKRLWEVYEFWSERDSFFGKTIITETFCSELFGVTQTFPK